MKTEAKIVLGLLLITVVLSSYAGVAWWFYGQGRIAEKAEYTERDRQAAVDANEQQHARRAELDEQRDNYENAIVAVTRNYEDRLKEKDREKAAAVVAARTGGLFIAAKCPELATGLPGAAAASGVSDGGGKARLSDEASEFLIAEAGRADQVTERLSALQVAHQHLYEFCRSRK